MVHADFKSPFPEVLAAWVQDARRRTLVLVADLSDQQLLGPRLPTVNPPLWELGHVAWFQEKWVLRHANGRPPSSSDADALYDSAAVVHDIRWDQPLPCREQTFRYLADVEEQVLGRLANGPGADELYFTLLSVFHEDMHAEAFTCTCQTLGYPAPHLPDRPEAEPAEGNTPLGGDVPVAGGAFRLGAEPDGSFVFDNEKWAHPVELRPFAIARAPVTQAEFVAFVEDGGYQRRVLWGQEGWSWRENVGAGTAGLLAAPGGRLAAAGLRPMGPAGPPPPGDPCQLARGGGLLSLGGPAPAHRGRVGGRGVRIGGRRARNASTRGETTAARRRTGPTWTGGPSAV